MTRESKTWLGGDANGEWSNHFELLGVPIGFEDVAAVDHIASLLLQRLEAELNAKPELGSHIAAIRQAQDCLTNPKQRKAYQISLGLLPADDPTNEPAAVLDDIPIAIPVAEPIAASSGAAGVNPQVANSPPLQFDTRQSGRISSRQNRSSRPWLTITTLALGVLLFAGLAYMGKYLLGDKKPTAVASGATGGTATGDTVAIDTSTGVIANATEGSSEDRYTQSHGQQVELPKPNHVTLHENTAGTRTVGSGETVESDGSRRPMNASKRRIPQDSPEAGRDQSAYPTPKADFMPTQPTANDFHNSLNDSQTSPTAADSTAEIEPLPAKDIKLLSQALFAIPESLASKNFRRANKALSVAKKIARHPRHIELVTSMADLVHYNQEYWAALDDAWADLSNGRELVVGSTRVFVVEVTDARITLRVAGTNKRYQRDQLPAGLQQTIVSSWLKQDVASTQLILGAFWAARSASDKYNVNPTGPFRNADDLEKAKEHWEMAKANGGATDSLLSALTTVSNVDALRKLESRL